MHQSRACSCRHAAPSTGRQLVVLEPRQRGLKLRARSLEEGSPPCPRSALHAAYTAPLRPVGGEHGQGFTSLHTSGVVSVVDVDRLNDQMRFTGAARLRMVQAPDQAYGLIFSLDHLITDTRAALVTAWRGLAEAHGLPCPQDNTRLLMHNTCPERIMMDVLQWSQDMKRVRNLTWELSERYNAALATCAEPAPGLRNWLEVAAGSHSMPAAAVTNLDRATARHVLERAHLHDHFSVLITADDEHETQAQALLAAAIQLRRPPNHCVFFDATPHGVTAAHNVSMKAVAVARPGMTPAWQLHAADVTVSSLAQLHVYNVRRLFANVGSEVGDLQKQTADVQPPRGRGRRVMNATL